MVILKPKYHPDKKSSNFTSVYKYASFPTDYLRVLSSLKRIHERPLPSRRLKNIFPSDRELIISVYICT